MSVDNTTYGHICSEGNRRYLKLDYSTEVISVSLQDMPLDIRNATNITDRISKGYISPAGYPYSGKSPSEAVKLVFHTETFSVIYYSIYQNVSGYYSFGIDGNSVKGYIGSGNDDRNYNFNGSGGFGTITYSNDVASAATELLGYGAQLIASTSNGISAGYYTGGYPNYQNSTIANSSTYKITYASDISSSVIAANLSVARGGLACVYNGGINAYFIGGGGSNVYYNLVDKLDFSTETAAAVTTANLSKNRFRSAGASSDGMGYILGGKNDELPYPQIVSIHYKLNYTTDTTSASQLDFGNLTANTTVLSQTYANIKNTGYGYSLTYGDGKCKVIKYNYGQPLGEIILGGSTLQPYKTFYIGSGDISLDGIGIFNNFYHQVITGSGLITIDGSAMTIGPYIGKGELSLNGTPPFKMYYIYQTFGNVIISGSSRNYYKKKYTGIGAVIFGGAAVIHCIYEINFSLSIIYAVLAQINKELPINYTVGESIIYGYRIESECIPATKPGYSYREDTVTCNSRIITTIFDSSVYGVCNQLTAQNWVASIKSMEKYTKPIYKSQEDELIAKGKYDSTIVGFVPVTFCNEPACLDFCVKYIVEENIAIKMSGGTTLSFYAGSGSVSLGGTSTFNGTKCKNCRFWFTGGSRASPITIYGSYSVILSNRTFNYLGSGEAVIDNNDYIKTIITVPFVKYAYFLASHNNYETLNQDSTVDMSVLDYEANFNSSSNFEITTGTIINGLSPLVTFKMCNCTNLSRRLAIQTNLLKDSDFYFFLNRNGIVFDEQLICYYDQISGRYNYTNYNKGMGTTSPNFESWNIVVDISCNNDLDNFNVDYIWIFDLYFKKKTSNYNDLDANIQIWIPSAEFCPRNKSSQASFDLQINVIKKTCLLNRTILLKNIFINDRIGLFNSTGWMSDPILEINASSSL